MLPIGDPGGKDLQFPEVADAGYAAEVVSSVTGALLDAGWKVGEQGALWLAAGSAAGLSSHPPAKAITFAVKGIWPVDSCFPNRREGQVFGVESALISSDLHHL